MKMRIERGHMNRADKVLKNLEKRNFSKKRKLMAVVGAYDNCREQGYNLRVYRDMTALRTFLFSEDRCSDNIVVYYTDGSFDRAFHANVMTEEMYATRKYFKSEKEAAEYIAKKIEEKA
jgi:hypothetical protein